MFQVKQRRFNARQWAKEFVEAAKANPIIPFDEECMFNWFSEALLVGYETRMKEKNNDKQS